jgi:hypothetical protein
MTQLPPNIEIQQTNFGSMQLHYAAGVDLLMLVLGVVSFRSVQKTH